MLTILINAIKKQYYKHRDSAETKRKEEKAIREKVERLTAMLTKMDDSINSLRGDVDAARVDTSEPVYSRKNAVSSSEVVYEFWSNWSLIVRLSSELPDNKLKAVCGKDNAKRIAILYDKVSDRYHYKHVAFIAPLFEAIYEESLPKKRSLYY